MQEFTLVEVFLRLKIEDGLLELSGLAIGLTLCLEIVPFSLPVSYRSLEQLVHLQLSG